METEQAAPAAFYDADYYGVGPGQDKANYRDYGPHSNLSWPLPLARLLALHTLGPVLDVGCAYGHLVRTLNRLGIAAEGCDWSPFAVENAVDPHVRRLDARLLDTAFEPESFACVVSLDLLEHLPPPDCVEVMQQMAGVLRPGGLMFHLLGAPMGPDDPSHHYGDPSHVCHEPYDWYWDRFANDVGMIHLPDATRELNHHPAWSFTDWAGRWLALRKPV